MLVIFCENLSKIILSFVIGESKFAFLWDKIWTLELYLFWDGGSIGIALAEI